MEWGKPDFWETCLLPALIVSRHASALLDCLAGEASAMPLGLCVPWKGTGVPAVGIHGQLGVLPMTMWV